MDNKNYTFNISLSVLNHLGRNLYRSFTTVLGEAISNSWDAEAENVWIYIDKDKNTLVITDDGVGMSSDDFQDKFLKIGYSKRRDGHHKSGDKKRPYIGRKGIGKLALLSCAEKITIISKKETTDYVGGVITNTGLDNAIEKDMVPQDYGLGAINVDDFSSYTKDHIKGTIILFEDLKGGIRNSLKFVRKTLSLYFRFSLLDKNFTIFVENKKIDFNDLSELSEVTEFCWTVNGFKDPFIEFLKPLKEEHDLDFSLQKVNGFIASVKKPSNMTIREMDEKLTVDLFVNGRLREKNILKRIASNRVPESYIYGQIHYNSLDGVDDPFTSSREGIVSDSSEYQIFLDTIKTEVIAKVINQWDGFRRKHKKPGDEENPSVTPKQRKAEEFYDETTRDYTKKGNKPKERNKVKNENSIDWWVDDLREDATFCFSSYADCYLSENLVRKFMAHKKVSLSTEAKRQIKKFKDKETKAKGNGNISIALRQDDKNDLSYLDMMELAALLDKSGKDIIKDNHLVRDAREYKPMRDALMHTSRLTEVAKNRLTAVFENIKGRIIEILNDKNKS